MPIKCLLRIGVKEQRSGGMSEWFEAYLDGQSDEREACAVLAEQYLLDDGPCNIVIKNIAIMIRARADS